MYYEEGIPDPFEADNPYENFICELCDLVMQQRDLELVENLDWRRHPVCRWCWSEK